MSTSLYIVKNAAGQAESLHKEGLFIRPQPAAHLMQPISGGRKLPKAKQAMGFEDSEKIVKDFAEWIVREGGDGPRFISDNNGFDWMFICWYFNHFLGKNPFGHSSTNLGSFSKGVERDFTKSFKGFRKTKHTHKAVDDAVGNAEAFLAIITRFGVKA